MKHALMCWMRCFRAKTFVDLYAVVRQGVRVGSESYSIKKLEPLYGFERVADLEEATVCRMAIEVALQRRRCTSRRYRRKGARL